MNTHLLVGVITVLLIVVGVSSLTKVQSTPKETIGNSEYQIDASDFLDSKTLTQDIDNSTALSDAERESLLFMREEEKLARDVYTTLGKTWGKQIFSNIARSEETHMSAVLGLLNQYDIPDPVTSDTVGSFTNPLFQELYTKLVAEGSLSEAKAFEVGATIEDLDIRDLNLALEKITNPAIIRVYQNLAKGSRNHLRAFNRQLEQVTGSTYQAKYISESDLRTILTSAQERGPAR